MAEHTANYNLEKQQGNEFVSIEGINGNFDIIDTELKTAQDKADQAFQSASNGKTAIKAAITGVDPDVTIPTDATFSQLAAAIGQIKTGVDTEDATATAVQILADMTAYVNGVKVTGTMTNRGAVNITPGTANQAIPKGYHNGSGVVAGDPDLVTGNIKAGVNIFGVNGKSSVVDTADANAIAANLLNPNTAYVGGVKITGAMPLQGNDEFLGYKRATEIFTPSYGNRIHLYVPHGAYITDRNDSSGTGVSNSYSGIFADDSDYIPSNILSTANIFGLQGTATLGRKIQSGATNSSGVFLTFKNGAGGDASMYSLTVTGLTFKPSYIMAFNSTSSTQGYYVIYKSDGIGLNLYNVKIFTGSTYYMTTNTTVFGFIEDGTASYVNSTSFRLPCIARDTIMYWVAIE